METKTKKNPISNLIKKLFDGLANSALGRIFTENTTSYEDSSQSDIEQIAGEAGLSKAEYAELESAMKESRSHVASMANEVSKVPETNKFKVEPSELQPATMSEVHEKEPEEKTNTGREIGD